MRLDAAPGTIGQCRVTAQKGRGTACPAGLSCCLEGPSMEKLLPLCRQTSANLFLPFPTHCYCFPGKRASNPGEVDSEHPFPPSRYRFCQCQCLARTDYSISPRSVLTRHYQRPEFDPQVPTWWKEKADYSQVATNLHMHGTAHACPNKHTPRKKCNKILVRHQSASPQAC